MNKEGFHFKNIVEYDNKEFYRFNRFQFVQTLRKISEAYKLPYIARCKEKELVDSVEEYIYTMKTPYKAIDILIYSSVDKKTNSMRKNGKDAVRLVYRWKLSDGSYAYKRIGKHLRIKTLFVNMRKTLVQAYHGVAELDHSDFVGNIGACL